ncbi:uncharacterized protein LOC121407001 [Lytechinus variegatus]|uniref:uncharacterized protein LOC121407001 n=1 Tax=Lytechinus variegatus TaxID=7654 RepID=UPI001BB168C5|nr:uncharacterized protein LOC121407001 [Lytechinus variegatus]
MSRLQNKDAPLSRSLKRGLLKYADSLIKFGNGKKKHTNQFTVAVSRISNYRGQEEREEAMMKAALLAIPGLLQEKLDNVFVSPGTESQNPVHIQTDAEDVIDSESFVLSADGETIATSHDLLSAAAMWVSSFYIFNLQYPSDLSKTLIFIQKVLLNIQDGDSTPRPIFTLINKLNIENASELR